MSTLHLVRKSAFTTDDFSQCLAVFVPHDTLILMDDGCYNLQHPLLADLFEKGSNPVNINVVSSHAQARAMKSPEKVIHIDMPELVELTFEHERVITWQ